MIAIEAISANNLGAAPKPAGPEQEAVMGHAVPTQHPAVVLRSHYDRLRALLVIALIAVGGLTLAVVSIVSDGGESAGEPAESINYGGPSYVNPSTGFPSGGLPDLLPSAGYDGGPVSRYEAEDKYFTVPSPETK
jgi:hypothetical protein